MRKFTQILENLTDQLNVEEDLIELENELIQMIDDSINSEDTNLKTETMKSYTEDSSTTVIGLVNDSDVFDLYLKHKNQFDKLLLDLDHFSKSPESLGSVSSVYEYVIESTKIGVQEVFRKLLDENKNEFE
tara:strand:+ start:66549 stop:66941 length:393 start_codon:yes stop_codon:yes gene_type:complete